MTEWPILYIAINLVIGIFGWMIRKGLARADERTNSIENKLEAILRQTSITNGRVGVLEDWRRTHEKASDERHHSFQTTIDRIQDRISHYFEHKP